jgi:hypothetical protein
MQKLIDLPSEELHYVFRNGTHYLRSGVMNIEGILHKIDQGHVKCNHLLSDKIKTYLLSEEVPILRGNCERCFNESIQTLNPVQLTLF